jgi:PAS domain S-box-containing protein
MSFADTLADLWRGWLKPVTDTDSPSTRLALAYTRTFSVSSIIFFILAVVFSVVTLFTDTDFTYQSLWMWVGTTLLVSLALASRHGHYRWPAIAVGIAGAPLLFVLTVFVENPRTIQVYDYLVIYAFIGLFMTTAPILFRLYLYNAVWILITPLFMPQVTWLDVIQGPLLFNTVIYAASIVTLSYYRKGVIQSQRILETSEARYRSLFEQSTDAVFLLDLEGNHITVNQRSADMMGYTREELLQQGFRNTVVSREQSLSESQREKLLNGSIVTPYERTFRRKNGEEFSAEVTLSLIRDVDGTPLYMQSIVRDLTERKRSEAERVKLLVVQERAATLGQFFSALSHDFRTNLSQIEMSSFLTERAITHNQHENAYSKLETIRSSIAHMTQQIQNLQFVASLSTLHTEPCDLNLLAQSVIAEVTQQAADKKIALSCELDMSMGLVPASEDKLRSALQHLLRNALTYTHSDGEVCVRTRQLENGAQVIVSDTGIGIAPEHQTKVFDLFYRADQSRTIDTGGFGLGLSIVKLIVEAHGGGIHLQSQPGSGTSVIITLPRL